MIKILVAGYSGSMGQQVLKLIDETPDFELVAVFALGAIENDRQRLGLGEQVKIYNELSQIEQGADVWIDFTAPSAVFENVKFALKHGMCPVVGTTGLTDEELVELKQLALAQQLGGLVAPNFGMSAVLLMKFAKEAAKYFPDVEIIEMHHDNKKDAPSGTALMTAKLIAQNRLPHHQGVADETETLAHVRGGDYEGIKLHSVRLPGYVAHEQVLFGGAGEALTIRQDSFDRASFMSGVKLAVKKAQALDGLVVGLENIL